MSQKAALPSLTGHRIKTRKRDEKKQYDPCGFRDNIIVGLNEAGDNLETVSKFIDAQSSKLDYRRYGCALIEILIAGGLLAPGGTLLTDCDSDDVTYKTSTCVFHDAEGSIEKVRAWEQVFVNIFRRYKYLEKMHEEAMSKVLIYLKGFTEEQQLTLAQITALWLADGHLPPQTLNVLINEHQVKDGTCLNFLTNVLCAIKSERNASTLISVVKKAGIESRILDFFPPNQQSESHVESVMMKRELGEVIEYRKSQAVQTSRNDLTRLVGKALADDRESKSVVSSVNEAIKKLSISETEAVVLIWNCLMKAVEWNKKEDLLQDQALKHIKRYVALLAAFTSSQKSEIELLNRIQDYCYENTHFLKIFSKIILLLYKTDVLSEEAILKWYHSAHSSRGWQVYAENIKKFIDWLEAAEEESDEESDDEDE